MARHLVAVCVVCLLCAEHFPCKGHIEGNENNKENLIKYSKDSRAEYLAQISHESNMNDVKQRKSDENVNSNVKNEGQREIVRLKRHTHHHHHDHNSKSNSIDSNLNIASSSKKYLGKIFSKYGSSESSQVMTLTNFDELLTKLDLKKLVVEQKDRRNGKIVNSNDDDVTVSEGIINVRLLMND